MKSRNSNRVANRSSNYSHTYDWKDVIESYQDKALALAILFILFAVIVFPKYEVKPYEIVIDKMIPVDFIPVPEPVIPKPIVVKPNIEILFETEIDTDDSVIPIVSSIPPTILDPLEELDMPVEMAQPRNYYYEEAPVFFKQVAPVYPEFYKKMKIEGVVRLEAELLVDGTFGEIEVVSNSAPGADLFEESAIKAFRQWKFRPAKVNNHPVKVWIQQPFFFKLN
jgi:protein TonB